VAVETSIRLTELVSCGGCAAKYPAALLRELVGGLAPSADPNLLVGLAPSDDAAVYRLDDERALVFTVDFFPALVDDPADFGAIAAANALNDVFAMGGRPLLALSVAAFPEQLPGEVVGAILGAAAEKVREAGGALAGGHTLRDDEPAFGLAVVGTVHPDEVWTKAGARPGDDLYLTKPLGTGLLVHAKRGLRAAVRSMRMLNAIAAELVRPLAPHAVTDVTGFGLAGHAYEIAERSGVGVELDAASLPALPEALEVAAEGVRTGGDRRNRAYVGQSFAADGASEAQVALAFDPQTAGGLLVALPAGALDGLVPRVGRVVAGAGVRLVA
jgi:selenide,water dikinase